MRTHRQRRLSTHVVRGLLLAAAAACTPANDADSDTDTDVAIDLPPERLALRGGGGPAVAFNDTDLGEHCAYLPGNLDRNVDEIVDIDHKNLVGTYRGHLVVPWAPEYGRGGLTFWDVSDPCNPSRAGEGRSKYMRETHNISFVTLPEGDPHAGEWAAVNMGGATAYVDLGGHGLQFWDVSDPAAPVVVSELVLDGLFYPDAYELINLAYSWAYPYVYVAGALNGLYVVDATDPTDPQFVSQIDVPDMRVGSAFAFGDLLLLTGSEQRVHALYDITDPIDPQPVLGGRFESRTGDGTAVEAYHTNLAGNLALFARKEGGGGPIVYDVTDPSNPTLHGEFHIEGHSGGYIFHDEGFLFTGDSNASHIVDYRDPANPELVMQINLGNGDLDTLTPYGNVAIAAVDDPKGYEGLDKGQGTAVVPWTEQPDDTPPSIMATRPADGATDVPITQALYVGFDEFVEPSHAISRVGVRLLEAEGEQIVDAWANAEESRVHLRPKQPLTPGTDYILEVMQGGLQDINGNVVPEATRITFRTVE